ncbi:MAG: hypothetical protein H6721_28120 [Sandaracinus sp.]|nr:hypothetical protein [Sandaracinus sp.]MCB9635995.1 hypothetical protein [Sandaracinus sp.]
MRSLLLSALLATTVVGCSKTPNLHEADGVAAAIEKLREHVDGSTRVYEVQLSPSDGVTPDVASANLRYDEGGTMMFRSILLSHAPDRQMAPRSETMGFLAGNTPRSLSEIDFSNVATNVMESTRQLPDDHDFRAVGFYAIRPNGTTQTEEWTLHTTPKDESTTTRTGNQVEVLYTEHRFQRGEDGTIRRVE